MKIMFYIPGEPQGKARPKFARRGAFVTTYTPKKTVIYEDLIRLVFKGTCGTARFPEKVPLRVCIEARFAFPKSIKDRSKTVYATKKPDADNIAKVVCDALNGVAWHDDAQVVKLEIFKTYCEQSGVTVIASDEL